MIGGCLSLNMVCYLTLQDPRLCYGGRPALMTSFTIASLFPRTLIVKDFWNPIARDRECLDEQYQNSRNKKIPHPIVF